MSKNKSLGSSPIGYSALSNGESSYQFIPDLGVSSSDSTSQSTVSTLDRKSNETSHSDSKREEDSPDKKIASYYLEVSLIDRLKTMADEQGSYYSSVASEALHHWIDIHGY